MLESGRIDPEDYSCSQTYGCKECARASIVSQDDPSPILELDEEILDDMAFFVERLIVIDQRLTNFAFGKDLAQWIAIIGSIGKQIRRGREKTHNFFRRRYVSDLAPRLNCKRLTGVSQKQGGNNQSLWQKNRAFISLKDFFSELEAISDINKSYP